MKLSGYHVATVPGRLRTAEVPVRAAFSTRSCELAVIDEPRWQLIEAGQLDRVEPEVLEQLVDMQLLVPDDEDELQAVLARNRAAGEDHDELYLVVQPTAACQLGCGYCGQVHEAHVMSPDDQRRLVERTAVRLDRGRGADGDPWRALRIAWFGAEPLLALPTLRSLSTELQRLAAERDIAYSAKVTTNGLELSEAVAAELLADHAVSNITITLDGPASVHDARRAWKTGRPSFERIWHNLLTIARRSDLAGLAIAVRANVDRSNAADFVTLARMLAAEGLAARVSLYPAPVHAWGNHADKDAPSRQEFAAMQLTWLRELEQLGFATVLLPGPAPLVCMSVTPHAEVVDAYGDVFNCSEMSQVPAYGRPNAHRTDQLCPPAPSGAVPVRLTPGRLTKRPSLHAVAAPTSMAPALASFNDVISAGEVPCHRCPVLPVCGGACPKQWLEGLKPCPAFKWNLSERLAIAAERAMAGALMPSDR